MLRVMKRWLMVLNAVLPDGNRDAVNSSAWFAASPLPGPYFVKQPGPERNQAL